MWHCSNPGKFVTYHIITAVQQTTESAGLENAGPIYTGGKRGTIIQVGGKRETSSYGTPMVPVL